MKILSAVASGLMLAATPFLAHAEGMSYSYVDLGYVETNIDGLSSNLDGFGLSGSVGIGENFFVFASYLDQSVSSVDFEQYSVGLGGHYGLSDTLDLVGRVGYVKAEVSASGEGSFDEDGYGVSAGLRSQVGTNVELEGSVNYVDFGSGSDDTALAVGGRYHFNKNFAAGLEYQVADDASTFVISMRGSF